MMDKKLNRRGFFASAAKLAGAAVVAPTLVNGLFAKANAGETRGGSAAGGGANLPLVEPGKGTAAAVNYVNDHKDVKDAKLKTDRQGVKFENQFCEGCGFYKAAGKKGADEVGSCTIFAGSVVRSKSWCASWNKKA